MAADAQTILNNINEIYTSELGRAADPGGAEFYSNLARGGTSLEDIRAQISGSAEGRALINLPSATSTSLNLVALWIRVAWNTTQAF